MFGTYDQGSSDRGLSSKLWLGVNPDVVANDPRHGSFMIEDFRRLSSDNYALTQATTGTFTLDNATGGANIGVGLLDCASTTATQGVNLQFDQETYQPTAGRKIVFETRLKVVDSATGPEFFAGLNGLDTNIIASSAIGTSNSIGFSSVTDDNVLIFGTEDATSRTEASASPHTLVEDTYVKLGFVVTGTDQVDIYVDGEKKANTTTMDIPGGAALFPSFVCQSGGSTDPIVHIDWYAVASVGA